jgi:hypothetical protein
MSESTHRSWEFYLDDMIACAENVIAYTDGLDQASFVASGLHYDATVRNLPQPTHPRLPGDRQRYAVEYHSGQYPPAAAAAT